MTRKNYSTEQYKVLVDRACLERGYENKTLFVGNISGRTILKLECRTHGEWNTTWITTFLNKGSRCPKCAKESRIRLKTKDESYYLEKFKQSGSNNLTFTRSDRLSKSGLKNYWNAKCEICSCDEYVANGVCKGEFEIYRGNITNGYMPCRCSPSFIWSREQREYQIRKVISEEGGKLEFIKWNTGYKNSKSLFDIKCKTHDVWQTTPNRFLSGDQRCPKCATGGFNPNKHAWVYILKVSNGIESFTGYGISNEPNKRLKDHKRNLAELGFSIKEVKKFDVPGQDAKEIEKQIIKTFPRVSQNCDGFRWEATDGILYSDVVHFVEKEIYERRNVIQKCFT